ncbi:hypothetical protein [Xenorhabdus sp. TH1]|uniref:hypothetical protein n=1 Tax=Xenorhabdus sp. TH1 TaxID=3130166 RepID=UPI0030CB75EE
MKKTNLNVIAVTLAAFLSGCSTLPIINSLEEREKAAYEAVVKEPNDKNIKRYMELADKVQKKNAEEAQREADKATRESDKGFIEYFKYYDRNNSK